MDCVAEAFAAVPRTGYLRAQDRGQAAYDGPIAIGAGQTNSQPRTVADMLRLLDVRAGQSILDVGAGSGWTTALLGHLVGSSGAVLGVELVPALAEFGAANLARARMPWSRLLPATPGVLGAPEGAPYDRILVSAQPPRLPEALVAQLRVGGVLVIPVAGRMLRVTRTATSYEATEHGRYLFVPLVETQ